MATGEGTARALGYFSVGLGLAQIVAPGGVAAVVGLRRGRLSCSVLRVLGVRELMAGIGILTQRRPAQWLWARAAGDGLDLALAASALASSRNRRGRVAATLLAIGAITTVDLQTAEQLMGQASEDGPRLTTGITVNRPPDEVQRAWQELLPRPDVSEYLRSARFRPAPGGRGTEIRVNVADDQPGGALTAALARLRGASPQQRVQADLRRAKQLIEAGEITLSDATAQGAGLLQRAGQPPAGNVQTLAGSNA
jgi:uncharacterized membrane protein